MRCTGNNLKLTINDLMVCYNDTGPEETPVIVFIHGFPLNKSMWDKQADYFEKNYRVITYDIRGHGGSDAGSEIFLIELFVNDLFNLMDKLELDKVSLCGLSMGGYIALNAVEKHPHRFKALILCDTQCTDDTPEAKERRMKTIENIKESGPAPFAEENLKILFAAESFYTKKREIAAVKKMIRDTNQQSLCNTLHALAERKETCSKLQDINIPVLIMVGTEDKITPPAAARLMHEKIPDSVLTMIEHAGHLSNMENCIEFNLQLEMFLLPLVKHHPANMLLPEIEP